MDNKITHLEIIGDYGGDVTGIWDLQVPIEVSRKLNEPIHHYPVTYDDLVRGGVNIPRELYDRIYAWARDYDWNCPTHGSEWDRQDQWDILGFNLATELKKVVGDSINVTYFNSFDDRITI